MSCSIEKVGESLWVFSIISIPEVSRRRLELAQGRFGSNGGEVLLAHHAAKAAQRARVVCVKFSKLIM